VGVTIGSRRGSIMARSFSAGICQNPFRKLNYYGIRNKYLPDEAHH